MKRFSLIIQGCFYFFSFFALNCFFSSCNKDILNIPDYIRYVRSPENGLSNSVTRSGFIFTTLQQPADYLTLKELRNEKITEENFASAHAKFVDYLYFDFAIRPEDAAVKILDNSDSATYEKRYQHFAFDIANEIFLVSNADTLPCIMHQFVSDNGVSPEYHFELMFNKPDQKFLSSDSLFFIYEDKLLNAGKISVPILTKAITNIPQLKI